MAENIMNKLQITSILKDNPSWLSVMTAVVCAIGAISQGRQIQKISNRIKDIEFDNINQRNR
jgi:4-hydroxybenzoate polyprenyltransferase